MNCLKRSYGTYRATRVGRRAGAQLDRALEAFEKGGKQLGVIA